MANWTTKTAPFAWTFVISLALMGCSTPGAAPFSLFPHDNKLTDQAESLRNEGGIQPDLARELNESLSTLYVVEPSDVLLIQPVKFDSPVRLPGDQTVLPDGTVSLGEHGLLHVAGHVIPEIELMVRQRVHEKEPNAGPITVRVVSRESKVYYVLGAVNAPGAFPWTGRETALDAIIAAGGLTDQASPKNVILVRPTQPTERRMVLAICYNDIVQLGDTTTNYQIQSGDRIFVAGKSFWDDLLHWHKGDSPCCDPPVSRNLDHAQ